MVRGGEVNRRRESVVGRDSRKAHRVRRMNGNLQLLGLGVRVGDSLGSPRDLGIGEYLWS